jgi:hypothetical protein
MFNGLVITMTLIAFGFVLAWWVRPDIRDWMEALSINLFDGVGSADAIGERSSLPHLLNRALTKIRSVTPMMALARMTNWFGITGQSLPIFPLERKCRSADRR